MSIDIGRLPAPDIVEPLDAGEIAGAWLREFQARYPAFSALVPSDPAMRLMEAGAYREMLLRQRINEAARAVMLPLATGADLDNLAANFGLARHEITPADPDTTPPRPAVMEDDEGLRRRALVALDGVTTAGSRASYIHHALSAHEHVRDVHVASPAPGEVRVVVLIRTGSAQAAVLRAVEAALNGDHVRPLGDFVHVAAATTSSVDVTAHLAIEDGPDGALVVAAARAALDGLDNRARPLGQGLARSQLYAALHQPGVVRVDLSRPATDIAPQAEQAVTIGTVTLTFSLASSLTSALASSLAGRAQDG